MQILHLQLVVDWQTDQPKDIVTYRAAIEANNMTTTTATTTTVTTTNVTTTTVTTTSKITMTTTDFKLCKFFS